MLEKDVNGAYLEIGVLVETPWYVVGALVDRFVFVEIKVGTLVEVSKGRVSTDIAKGVQRPLTPPIQSDLTWSRR